MTKAVDRIDRVAGPQITANEYSGGVARIDIDLFAAAMAVAGTIFSDGSLHGQEPLSA